MPAYKSALLPRHAAPVTTQKPGRVTLQSLARVEHLLVAIPEKPAGAVWRELPDGARLRHLRRRCGADGLAESRLTNKAQTGISVGSIADSGKGRELPGSFELLTAAGSLAAAALRNKPGSIGIMAVGFAADAGEQVIRALLLALHAHTFALPDYRQKPATPARLRSIRVLGMTARIDVTRAETEAAATNLARWLTAQPPNKLDMPGYRAALEDMARVHGWQTDFLDVKKLTRLGAGAFLAVSQGNAAPGAGIMKIKYRPRGTNTRTPPALSLVGKGIIFDTGGTNLKPFKAMLDMHHDMAGSAVAIATLRALTELSFPYAVDCWLAITENRISGEAYKSRDVVTASNGTTIEIIHTDAEGRMALADTLALAGREQPRGIIDFATLTGSCVAALTERYSGVFSNRAAAHAEIIAAGRDSGERVWPFPMDADFDTEIKSKVADVLQCAPGGGGDHIQAARFLQRFIPPQAAWVHVDLSAATRKGGLAQVPGEVTGFGVRFALSLILDHDAALGLDMDSDN